MSGREWKPGDVVELLSIDPLAEAERITGLSYKDDDATMRLGFGLHVAHNATKTDALKEARDSHHAMNLVETLALYAELGFTEVLLDEFLGATYDDAPAPLETYRILWHAEGILATVESYETTRRNATKVYYNLAVTERNDLWSRISSGHLATGDVWVGDHDGREGVRTNLARLREVGEFLPVWVEQPFLWLITYAETKGDYDYKAINAGRISRLPVEVQAAIAGGVS